MVAPTQTGELLPAVGVDGIAFTVIVIALDVAGLPITPPRLEVIIQVTIFPFAKVVEVNVDEVAPPTFTPLICHWYVGVAPPFVGVAVNVAEAPAHIGFVPVV